MNKKYEVFCMSGPERCTPFEYLGTAEMGQALRCGRCGRYTGPGTRKIKSEGIKNEKRKEICEGKM